jgi:hypothetical protein
MTWCGLIQCGWTSNCNGSISYATRRDNKGLHGGCLENFSRGDRCHWFKVYSIAEPLDLSGQSINRIVPPPFAEAVCAQLVIRFLVCEHMKDTDHDGVGDHPDRTLLAPPGRQAPIQG